MIGYAGRAGAGALARANREQLAGVFPAGILSVAARKGPSFPVPDRLAVLSRVRLGEGGVLRGLWILGEKLQCGLDVEIGKVLLRQEDVEVCEMFGADLYRIDAGGGWLIAVRNAQDALRVLQQMEIPSSVIGSTTTGRRRTVWMGDMPRYLEGP